jgi:hypothetical protein
MAMISTHASVLGDSVGPPSVEVCRTAASFPYVDHPRFIELREEQAKLSLSSNPAITIQEVSCVPNTPNTLVRYTGALVRQRDSKIQVIWMVISSKYNLK